MDVLSVLWALGETLSIFVLLAGASLSFIAREPFFSWYMQKPLPEVHDPFNHRLLLEAEW